MEPQTIYFVSSAFYYVVWLLILAQGYRLGLLRRYPLLFVYVAASLVANTANLVHSSYWGISSEAYGYFSFWSSLPMYALEAAIILSVYFLAQAPSFRSDWPLIAALPTLVVVELVSAPNAHYIQMTQHILVFFVAYLGFRTIVRLFRTPGMAIGKNVGSLVAGLFFPTALQAVNQAAYMSGFEFWTYSTSYLAAVFTQMASWLIILLGLSQVDPPRPVETSIVSAGQARAQLSGLVAALWGLSKC